MRERLGIPDGRRAVLYAPTCRDDAVFDERVVRARASTSTPFAAALGDDHVLLLRLHYLVDRRARRRRADRPCATSPTTPTSSELYLAADVLVTDYSSMMFDFAVTGRPMVFLTYDLADFRDRAARLLLRPRGRGARAAGRDDRAS